MQEQAQTIEDKIYFKSWTTYFKEYSKVSLPYLVKGFDVNKSL